MIREGFVCAPFISSFPAEKGKISKQYEPIL